MRGRHRGGRQRHRDLLTIIVIIHKFIIIHSYNMWSGPERWDPSFQIVASFGWACLLWGPSPAGHPPHQCLLPKINASPALPGGHPLIHSDMVPKAAENVLILIVLQLGKNNIMRMSI